MLATGWQGGDSGKNEPGSYGIRFIARDRDRWVDRSWETVVLELDGASPAVAQVSESFWRRCSELRSAELGRWLLSNDVAPWPSGRPPNFVVTPIESNRFAVRLHVRKSLPGVG